MWGDSPVALVKDRQRRHCTTDSRDDGLCKGCSDESHQDATLSGPGMVGLEPIARSDMEAVKSTASGAECLGTQP